MKRANWIRFGLTAAVVFASLGLLFPFWPLDKVINLGLDLKGGTRIELVGVGVSQLEPEKQKLSLIHI